MKYNAGNRTFSYHAEGQRITGPSKVLLHDAVDLTKGKTWAARGFTIEPLFDEGSFKKFVSETRTLLFRLWRDAGLIIEDNFLAEDYHTVASSFGVHLNAVNATRLIQTKDFPLGIQRIESRISEICQVPLRALNPFDGQSIFHFRVIRPQSGDNNPLHRDVWLEDYADCINLYIPVAGSNELSSLILIPGSHRWPESLVERTIDGAIVNGVRFNVPAVTEIRTPFDAERPNPADNQVLVFSPYLIHGGSVNQNADKTRISIELRLWKK
jgi:hypothetical protein